MKKVIVIASAKINDDSNGVTQKLISQVKAFSEFGAIVDFIGYGDDCIIVEHNYDKGKFNNYEILREYSNAKKRRIYLWKKIEEFMCNNEYDMAYIRYPVFDYYVLRALKTIRVACKKVVMEVPSYPLVFKSHGIIRRLQFETDRVFQKKCGKYIDRVLYVGNETDTIFGCKAVQIANGLPEEIRKIKHTGYKLADSINLICVSNMYNVHGYDRLINGLANYYDNRKYNNYIITITMVGDGPCMKEYEKIANERGVKKYVKFKGVLKGDKLTEAFEDATIGIGGLGLYREGLEEASSLKTKEYLVRGLPFVYAGKELGLDEDFPFAYMVPNTDEAINMYDIISFVESIRNYKPTDVMNIMEKYANEHFSWTGILNSSCGDLL